VRKSELKELIKECVREVVFEEGSLRTIVTEVAQGLGTAPLVEQKKTQTPSPAPRESVRSKIIEAMGKNNDPYAETRSRMPNSKLFEGTVPLDEAERGASVGVDITNIPGVQNWSTIANQIGKK
jgi:hypothetical protein